jgi:hypothetical protein
MSLSPDDERLRLAQLFSNMPQLDEQLATLESGWEAVLRNKTSGKPFTEFELSSGLAKLDLTVFNRHLAYLTWRSDLPGVLSFTQDMESYERFLRFLSQDFPRMAYGPDSEVPPRGFKGTLRYKSSQVRNDFDLLSEKDRLRLISELITRRIPIAIFTISGSKDHKADIPFSFSIFNPTDGSDTTLVKVGFPREEEQAWNARVLSWALSTHAQRDRIGNIEQSAEALAQVIRPLLQLDHPNS